jgi:hypothetical protein
MIGDTIEEVEVEGAEERENLVSGELELRARY